MTGRSPPGETVLVSGASSWWDLHRTPPQAPAKDPGHAGGTTPEDQVPFAQEEKTANGL